MFIKIYFDDKPVYLCNEITNELKEILHHPDAIFIDEVSGPAIKTLLHEIKKEAFHAGVLLHTDLDQLKKEFFKQFEVIEAAGGIVQNDQKNMLFIYRLNKWDLPKGKVEKGENFEQAALREVEEETGVTHLQLKNKIGCTFHTYNAFGKHFIKTTHWYYMTCSGEQQLVPQTEEHITALQWINMTDIGEPLGNTYASIRDIVGTFIEKNDEPLVIYSK
jgi:8-oxo-dGTP pyrophosphatase MutT (NUDIX family)